MSQAIEPSAPALAPPVDPASPAVSVTSFAEAMQGPHAPTLRLLQGCADSLVSLWQHAFEQPGPAFTGVTHMLFDSFFQEMLGDLQTITITLGSGLDPQGQPVDDDPVRDALLQLHDAHASPRHLTHLERVCGQLTRQRFERLLSNLTTAAQSL